MSISTQMYVVEGRNEYGGGRRQVTAEVDGAHVKLTCAGDSSDAAGESLLTPDQARYLGHGLITQANSVSNFYSELIDPGEGS